MGGGGAGGRSDTMGGMYHGCFSCVLPKRRIIIYKARPTQKIYYTTRVVRH